MVNRDDSRLPCLLLAEHHACRCVLLTPCPTKTVFTCCKCGTEGQRYRRKYTCTPGNAAEVADIVSLTSVLTTYDLAKAIAKDKR
jgi:hypothetical protein